MPARTLGLLLSLWLFFSAFAWPRGAESFANAWLVGLFAGAASVAGMRSPVRPFRRDALSAWLVASAFVLPRALLARVLERPRGRRAHVPPLARAGTMYAGIERLHRRRAHA